MSLSHQIQTILQFPYAILWMQGFWTSDEIKNFNRAIYTLCKGIRIVLWVPSSDFRLAIWYSVLTMSLLCGIKNPAYYKLSSVRYLLVTLTEQDIGKWQWSKKKYYWTCYLRHCSLNTILQYHVLTNSLQGYWSQIIMVEYNCHSINSHGLHIHAASIQEVKHAKTLLWTELRNITLHRKYVRTQHSMSHI